MPIRVWDKNDMCVQVRPTFQDLKRQSDMMARGQTDPWNDFKPTIPELHAVKSTKSALRQRTTRVKSWPKAILQ